RGRKAVQQQDGRRVGGARFAIENVQALDAYGLVGRRNGGRGGRRSHGGQGRHDEDERGGEQAANGHESLPRRVRPRYSKPSGVVNGAPAHSRNGVAQARIFVAWGRHFVVSVRCDAFSRRSAL